MTAVALAALITLTGFSLSWSSSPAPADGTGSALVTVLIEDTDLLAVTTAEGPRVRYEITATIDGGGFLRRGGNAVNSPFPISEVLEYGSLEPGGHLVAVTLTDLESGSVNRRETEVFIDSVSDYLWTSGAVRFSPDGPVRASGRIGVSWNVYVPEGAGIPRGAFALLDGSTEAVREGWLEGQETEEGIVSFTTDVVLSGLEKGRYRLTVAALSDQLVVASAGTSLTLLDSWDIWGDDPDETAKLIRPIASTHELSELASAGGLGDRNSVMADFWNRRDPNPATRRNEYIEEYLRRLDYISREFTTTGVRGINTDRGVVFAKMGEPDIIANYPFELADYPYITWEYFTPPLRVAFVDQTGYGFYELVEEWEVVNRAFNAREEWSQQ